MNGFRVVFNLVLRDAVQTWLANEARLNDPDVKQILRLWARLTKNPNFRTFEEGGADIQVAAMFSRQDPMEVYRQLRQVAPNVSFRPLLRGLNGSFLKPMHIDDLTHMQSQMIRDLGYTDKPRENALIKGKIFDSQGITEETAASVNIFNNMCEQGYSAAVEIAIPYSGAAIYVDEFYLAKVEEAFRLLQTAVHIPMRECSISLKDMVGQLSEERATSLIPKIIVKLKALQAEAGIEEPPAFALHLHDTGLAAKTYTAAIKACHALDYPILIDTVECDENTALYHGEDSWKNTGFERALKIADLSAEQGIDLGITVEERGILQQIGELTNKLFERYHLVRAVPSLSGEELRDFEIPGGGFSSFSRAVAGIRHDNKVGLANILECSPREALLLAGAALKTVWLVMGRPFAVTPGFQMKQNFALGLIQYLLETNQLNANMSFVDLQAKLEQQPNDNDVKILLEKYLKPDLLNFMSGEMPAETLRAMGIKTDAQVHPLIRKACPRRQGLSNHSAEKKIDRARMVVERLYAEGKLKPTVAQEIAVKQEFPDFHEDGSAWHSDRDRAPIVKQRVIDTYISFALCLTEPEMIESMVKQPWLARPNASEYADNAQAYERAMRRFASNVMPKPQELEFFFQEMKSGYLTPMLLSNYVQALLEYERTQIWARVISFIQENMADVGRIVGGDQDVFNNSLKTLLGAQEKIINDNEALGGYYVFPKERILQIAEDYFCQQLAEISQLSEPEKDRYSELKQAAHEKMNESRILSPMPGTVTEIKVKQGDAVKEGQQIATIEAMKLQHAIYADKSGVVQEVAVKQGAVVIDGQQLFILQEKSNKASPSASGEHDRLGLKIRVANDQVHAHAMQAHDIREQILEIINEDKPEAPHTPMPKLQAAGIFTQALSVTPYATQSQKEIHVLGNRSTCLLKLYGDLQQLGRNTRVLYTQGDRHLPLVQSLPDKQKILVNSYHKDHEEILDVLKQTAKNNPGGVIYFHPGWGFLSENAQFVAKLEALAKNYPKIKFVGPSSQAMTLIGGKVSFRDFVQKVTPKLNPKYFANHNYTAKALKEYIDSGFNKEHVLHAVCEKEYDEIVRMGGHVAIKADGGGGGYGIEPFKVDDKKSATENRHDYIKLLHKNVAYSEVNFNSGVMLTEQFIGGKTRHLEVQIAVNKNGASVLGLRDCTQQIGKQKTNETNIIAGDYADETISDVRVAAKKLSDAIAESGYQGLATLEAMVDEHGKVYWLEANTRLQVEHGVTEVDIANASDVNISLPILNYLCIAESSLTPAQILKMYFGLSPNQLASALALSNTRCEQIRINSTSLDLLNGRANPSFFWGDMWPGMRAMRDIFKHFAANIIVGDIGAGDFNAHTGSIWGNSEYVQAAAEKIAAFAELARLCMRDDGVVSIDSVLELQTLMYEKNRNFNPEFSTKSVDAFLKPLMKGQLCSMNRIISTWVLLPSYKLAPWRKPIKHFWSLRLKNNRRTNVVELSQSSKAVVLSYQASFGEVVSTGLVATGLALWLRLVRSIVNGAAQASFSVMHVLMVMTHALI